MVDDQRQWEAAYITMALVIRQLVVKKIREHEYAKVHHAVSRKRGEARLHECVDCGSDAADWSYNNEDPNERLLRSNSTPYSLDPANYDPRCRRCHIRFDGDVMRAHRRTVGELLAELADLEQQVAEAQKRSLTQAVMTPEAIENASA